MKKLKKDFRLGFESLNNKVLLSSNPWYVDAIKADIAWTQMRAIKQSVVAIVDSGVDMNHPALKDNLWTNPLEVADGKDNDGNGYVDDLHGWDFVDRDNIPQDGFYHGTHVAGIVDTVSNNVVKILPLRTHGDNGSGYSGSIVAAINYAIKMKQRGVNIAAINCSWGGETSIPSSLSDSIKRASDSGIVVVMAAGNNADNLDVTPRYPGSLNYANTITVAATNSDNSLAGYSNYGINSVAVGAPGTSIYSTLPGGTYGNVSGTSMATAVISGAVGWLRSTGNYNAGLIKNAILKGAEFITSLSTKISNGLLNLYKAAATLNPSIMQTVKLDYLNNDGASGWARILNSNEKCTVEIYINKILQYHVVADQYRSDTGRYEGFKILIDRKLLTQPYNLIGIRIKDSTGKLQYNTWQYLQKI